MSLQTFTPVTTYTNELGKTKDGGVTVATLARTMWTLSTLLIIFTPQFSWADWKVDFSRRTKPAVQSDSGLNEPTKSEQGFFKNLFTSTEPSQELVIMNTERGFVPSLVHVKQGGIYKIHVVNVNEREKNVSFVLDAFSEHHATYFGKIKTFEIRPQKDGIYRFVSPETSAQGRLVVVPSTPGSNASIETRSPASESGDDR